MRRLAHARDVNTFSLSFAVRPVDHFFGLPIPEKLSVSLVGDGADPIRTIGGSSRHLDGTYRFAGLPAGAYDVVVSSPRGTWRADASPTGVTSPMIGPAPVDIAMWPTTRLEFARGLSAVRATLRGPSIGGLRVELGDPDLPLGPPTFSGHFTHADSDGELLWFVPRVRNADARGLLTMVARIDGGARTVNSIAVAGAGPTPGDTFEIEAGQTSRVIIDVA